MSGPNEEALEGAALGIMDLAVSLHLFQDSNIERVFSVAPALSREGQAP